MGKFEEGNKETKRIRCAKCNSTQTYYRSKTDSLICHSCGYVEKNEISEDTGEEEE